MDKLEDLNLPPAVTYAPATATEDFLSESERRKYKDEILLAESEKTAQKIIKEMMQKCIAIGQESH